MIIRNQLWIYALLLIAGLALGEETPAAATKTQPFVNSLEMKFVPVPIYGGPTRGQRVLFSAWDTRVQDYGPFAKATKRPWLKPHFLQGPTHPAVLVSWNDAHAFCAWLTDRERQTGKIGANERYRLPSDHEWSCAVGMGKMEDAAALPLAKDRKIADVFPWGRQWPPPEGAGNFAGDELQPLIAAGKYTWIKCVPGYRDAFIETAPVGSFRANRFGLFDLAGNVTQWCEDFADEGHAARALRGSSWHGGERTDHLSSRRYSTQPYNLNEGGGFRCVLVSESPAR